MFAGFVSIDKDFLFCGDSTGWLFVLVKVDFVCVESK